MKFFTKYIFLAWILCFAQNSKGQTFLPSGFNRDVIKKIPVWNEQSLPTDLQRSSVPTYGICSLEDKTSDVGWQKNNYSIIGKVTFKKKYTGLVVIPETDWLDQSVILILFSPDGSYVDNFLIFQSTTETEIHSILSKEKIIITKEKIIYQQKVKYLNSFCAREISIPAF